MCLGNRRTQQCLEDFIWHLALGSGVAFYQAFQLYLRNSCLVRMHLSRPLRLFKVARGRARSCMKLPGALDLKSKANRSILGAREYAYRGGVLN